MSLFHRNAFMRIIRCPQRTEPNERRMWVDMTPAERREEREWRRTATPEQMSRADDLRDLWYREKDAAEQFSEALTAIMDRKFA